MIFIPVRELTDYFDSVLKPQLSGFGVSVQFVEHVCRTAEKQMLSALYHWMDIPFRKALLLLASEEGLFYEPSGKTEVKCFVVLTLRNSPFETLQSDSYGETGLSKQLSNDQIKAVTSAAKVYFNKLSFERLSGLINDIDDIYGKISTRCSVSWRALTHLAVSKAKHTEYPKIQTNPFELDGIIETPEPGGQYKAILDGYSLEIDQLLNQQLNTSVQNGIAFTVDCFKMLTRNAERLLSVMEYLLTRGCAFTTSNYFISNGYVERRPSLLRAASCENIEAEMAEHFSQTKGLGYHHTAVLENVYEQLFGEV